MSLVLQSDRKETSWVLQSIHERPLSIQEVADLQKQLQEKDVIIQALLVSLRCCIVSARCMLYHVNTNGSSGNHVNSRTAAARTRLHDLDDTRDRHVLNHKCLSKVYEAAIAIAEQHHDSADHLPWQCAGSNFANAKEEASPSLMTASKYSL